MLMITVFAIFNPFCQLCEVDLSLPSLQIQPNAAPNLFQRGLDQAIVQGNYIKLRQGNYIKLRQGNYIKLRPLTRKGQ